MSRTKTEKEESDTPITLNALLDRVDPMQATIMLLGGTASASGIVPPMTKLLEALNGNSVADTWHLVSTPGYQLIGEWLSGSSGVVSDPDKIKTIGLFCSGAVEAAIMYQFVQEPEVKRAILALPGQAIQGIGKIIK